MSHPLPEDQYPASPDPEPGSLADPPGWASLPAPLPGPAAPDTPAGAASGSAASGTPLLTPASFKGKSDAYAAIAKALLIAVAGLMNGAVATSDEDDAFIPDADDERDIPAPVGRLAARRIPLGDGSENFSDLADIGAASVAGLAWLAKGTAKMLTARRRLRRAVRSGGATIAPDFGAGDQEAGQ